MSWQFTYEKDRKESVRFIVLGTIPALSVSMKHTPEIIHVGIAEALAEIHRQAEQRLAVALRPGRLSPIENYSHRNGRAASAAVIAEIRAASSFPAR